MQPIKNTTMNTGAFPTDLYKEIILTEVDDKLLKIIHDLNIELDHGHINSKHSIQFAITASDLNLLDLNNIPYEITHENLEEFYLSRLSNDIESRDFDLGSMGGYYTFDEIEQHLDDLYAEYPTLVQEKISIGQTQEGRDIWAIKLSDNPNIDEDEPEILYTGLHHAREPMGYMNLFYFMQSLVENYPQDDLATYLLENRELWFIPAVNPDSLVYNQQIAPNGGGMQRKNMQETCTNNNDNSLWDGVDLNRNYSFLWGLDNTGSSPNGCNQTYRGTAAFSEPETQAIRDFITAHDFPIAFNYHSYSNFLIYPYGYDYNIPYEAYNNDTYDISIDGENSLDIFIEFGQEITSVNNYTLGTGPELLYPVNGEACDWMFAEHDILAYTPEIGSNADGFWPPTDRIIPLAEDQLYANQFVALASGPKYLLTMSPSEQSCSEGSECDVTININNHGLSPSLGNVILATVDQSNNPFSLDIGELDDREFSADFNLSIHIPENTPLGIFDTPLIELIDNNVATPFTLISTIQIGTQTTLFHDDFEHDLEHWETNSWGIATDTNSDDQYITDSPNGDYNNNTITALTLNETIDLSSTNQPILTFEAKWDIEDNWDWVQILISTNNNDWIPLTGEHTQWGSGQGTQNTTEHGYDGQQATWVTEKISLTDYQNESQVKFKFQLTSDTLITEDGFSLDDFSITSFIQLNDLNYDNSVNILDVILLVNIILETYTPDITQLQMADINHDSNINVLDITEFVDYILNQEDIANDISDEADIF